MGASSSSEIQVYTTTSKTAVSKPRPYYMGPCHHSLPCPQVMDGGYGHQIWRVNANVLNKQLWTANKGWSSSLRVG